LRIGSLKPTYVPFFTVTVGAAVAVVRVADLPGAAATKAPKLRVDMSQIFKGRGILRDTIKGRVWIYQSGRGRRRRRRRRWWWWWWMSCF
jgi:hypothetical protein